jgi:putative nucleotidyltransferase with HDIG domain
MMSGDCREMVGKWIAEGSFADKLPEVAALCGVMQPEEYHAEGDAFTHTMLAIEAVHDDADPRIFWAVLLHDIGKSVKTELINGRWRSIGHAEAGAEMVHGIMNRLGFPLMASDVAWLVRQHMFHFSWNIHPGAKITRNQNRFMAHPLFTLLLQVCAADAAASYGRSDKGDVIRKIAGLLEDESKEMT